MNFFSQMFLSYALAASCTLGISDRRCAAKDLPQPVLRVPFDASLIGVDKEGLAVPVESEGVVVVEGKMNQAGRFVGERHSYLKFDSKYLNLEKGTLSTWVRLNRPTTAMSFGGRRIFNNGGWHGTDLFIRDDRLAWNSFVSPRLGWKQEEWHHLAVTWKPEETNPKFPYRYDLAIYVDGKGVAFQTFAERPWKRGPVTLGSYPVPSYGRTRNFELEGDLDEFLLYDTCLVPYHVASIAGLSEKVASKANLPRPPPLEPGLNLRKGRTSKVKNAGLIVGKGWFATILLARDATPEEKLAAEKLAKYLRAITGAESIGIEPVEPGRLICEAETIYVGRGAAEAIGLKIPELAKDEIFLQGTRTGFVLVGGGKEGTRHAVSELLERLGVRWYTPELEGTFIPRSPTIRLPLGEFRDKPFFSMRVDIPAGPPLHDWTEVYEWCRLTRTQGDRLYHKMHRMVTEPLLTIIPESLYQTHPEYFGMNDVGKRDLPSKNHINPCTSNPEVVRKIVDTAIALLQTDPEADYFGIEPIDGGGWCQCPDCKAIDAEPGNYTDRVVVLANQIAKAVDGAFPGKGKGARFFAYQGYVYPPKREKLAENVQVEVTQGEPELLREWAAHASSLQRWSYYGYWSYHWGPLPGMHRIVNEARLLKQLGYQGWMNEGAASVFTMAGPYAYVMSKLMWNPDVNISDLLNDFFRGYYGKAAKPMRQCFNLLEEHSRRYHPLTTWDFHPGQYPPSSWEKCLRWEEEGEQLAKGDPWVITHLKIARLAFLLPPLARDVFLAEQYAAEPDYAYWKDLNARKPQVTSRLLEGIKLAQELKVVRVRSTVGDPPTLDSFAALCASALKLESSEIEKLFFPPGPPSQQSRTPEKAAAWTLSFQDDFMRNELGADWRVKEGRFSVKDGCLFGNGLIYISRKFPGDQRVEYEGWVNKGQTPCDLSAVLGSSGNSEVDGFFFGFGSNGNNQTKLLDNGAQVFSRTRPVIEPGKRHTVICEKQGRRLAWWVDGEKVMEYTILRPSEGEHAGFYIYTEGQIGWVKVYTK